MIVLNSGRRVGARPLATAQAARVRMPWQSTNGHNLPTITDSMTAAAARTLAWELLLAAAEAEAEHRALTVSA